MNYLHRFQIKAPISSVAAFHQQHTSMGAITPPPIRVELHRVPARMSKGGAMEFTLWFGPLPIHWAASIEGVSESGFTDRQLSGPFSKWVHRHSFIRVDDRTTEVIDQISLRLKAHPCGSRVAWDFYWAAGAVYYRAWKTRALEGSDPC
jgi:ligand-binding SRPBCC domain-containing protein